MHSFWKSAFLLLSIAASATSVSAQNHPMPGAVPDPAVICTGCPGTNSVGEVNDGKPTFPYDTPISVHRGRFVDSASTGSVQNQGMRTIRAGIVRVAPIGRNRIYLQLGETLGAYTFDTFFTGKLAQAMVAVNTLPPPNVSNPFGGRNPFEKLAKPDQYFYAESTAAGWTTPLADQQTVLMDFDADDRGNVYIGTALWGWGISSDPGAADGSHLTTVVQVTQDAGTIARIISLRNGATYYVFHSNGTSKATLYDVTAAASPQFLTQRTGSTSAFTAWSKFDDRVALVNEDGHVRVYTVADLVAGSAPLVDVTPSASRRFWDVSFDDDGNLWLVESPSNLAVTTNVLWKLTPSGGGYTSTTFDVYGSAFAASKIHASAGYVAVGGRSNAPAVSDVRLFRVIAGAPVLLDTDGFFRKYYSSAPSGFAQPGLWASTLSGVRIVAQGAKTYLFYSSLGLGDVYELGDGPRITSIAPLSGSPVGGTNVDLYGSGFAADATVTFGGVTASSSFVNDAHMTAVTPVHASGLVDVVVSVPGDEPMTAPKQFTYILDTPQQVVANATSTDSVSVSWNAVPGALQYEVSRRLPAGTWTVIGTPAVTTFVDGGRSAETTYVYRVRANDGADNFSAYSAVDLATTMSSQSANIVAGTPIVAVDFTNLRTRVNAVRAAAGLSAFSFTGALSGAVLAQHMSELRTALTQGRTSLGLTTPAFTDPTLTCGVKIKAAHLNELLDLMR